jgi:hypothetical protein
MRKAALLLLPFVLNRGVPAAASDSPRDAGSLCEEEAIHGAAVSGVPVEVLQAISLVETGRARGGRLRPWPWAVNRAGDGRWFADRVKAMDFARATLDTGRTNLDTGCFQMNYHYHGRRFENLDQMFDPVAGGIQAGAYLKSLHAETGDWSRGRHLSLPDASAGAGLPREVRPDPCRSARRRAARPADPGGGPSEAEAQPPEAFALPAHHHAEARADGIRGVGA